MSSTIDFDEIEDLKADAIAIDDAPKYFPGKIHKSTVWRWALYGLHGVRLKTFKIGARRYTTKAAIREFARATTPRE